MDRRDMIKGVALLPLIGEQALANAGKEPSAATKRIKPKRLRVGDTIAVIAPSSAASPEAWERAIANVETLGMKAVVGKFARGSHRFFSGTDEERLHDLHWAFQDRQIDGVWCVRGGSGAPRLLPKIDYKLIRRNPKVFIGYSDITALHLAISQQTGLVTFHGPVASSELSDYSRPNLVNTIMTTTSGQKIVPSEYNISQSSALFKPTVITAGRCRGRLIGGNLSLLAALAGTPYALSGLKGSILFAEDINEPPYKIDRLFTQLRQSVNMHSLAGIALGIFSSDKAATDEETAATLAALKDRLGDLGIPVVTGLSFGHIRDQCTLPLGIEADLDTATASITLRESAVV